VKRDTEKSFRLKPTITVTTKGPLPTIGIGSASTTELAGGMPAIPGTAADKASPSFQGGDVMIEIDGQPVASSYDINAAFAARPNEPLAVKVERTQTNEDGTSRVTQEELVVQANPLRRVGLVMKAGPVVSIAPDSVAKSAGFEVGDSIVSIGDEPLDDPMMLPTLLVPHYGRQVEIKVRRGENELTLPVDLTAPQVFDWNPGYNSPMVAEALGLAIEVQPKVERIIPGSSAEKELKAGDTITAFKIVLDNPPQTLWAWLMSPFTWLKSLIWGSDETVEEEEPKTKDREESDPVGGESFSWPFVFHGIQKLGDDRTLVLSIERSGQAFNVELKPQDGIGFNPDRGFVFVAKQEINTAKSWGEAFMLGGQRTKEDASRVLLFLRKLVSGQISLSNVGGPIMIATIAGSEASAGLPRLLIFLTFLSANLAVVNFLPIPALDGGHFLFLLWEGISGKPVNERVQIALTLAGVACLLCLMLFVVVMDIDRLFF
jgi:regulator of sigma E protease